MDTNVIRVYGKEREVVRVHWLEDPLINRENLVAYAAFSASNLGFDALEISCITWKDYYLYDGWRKPQSTALNRFTRGSWSSVDEMLRSEVWKAYPELAIDKELFAQMKKHFTLSSTAPPVPSHIAPETTGDMDPIAELHQLKARYAQLESASAAKEGTIHAMMKVQAELRKELESARAELDSERISRSITEAERKRLEEAKKAVEVERDYERDVCDVRAKELRALRMIHYEEMNTKYIESRLAALEDERVALTEWRTAYYAKLNEARELVKLAETRWAIQELAIETLSEVTTVQCRPLAFKLPK